MTHGYQLHIKPEADGFGFLYGTLSDGVGAGCRVDIMPPLPHWHGSIMLTGEGAPHPTDWVVYVDGNEIARVSRREDIEAALVAALPTR